MSTLQLQSVVSALDEALRRVLPDVDWSRDVGPAGRTWRLSSTTLPGRRLEVEIRDDLDIQVNWHTPVKRGSPFEALFVVDDTSLAGACEEGAALVSDLIHERVVVAMTSGVRGGRVFVPATEIREMKPSRIEWVESWRGTHDQPPSPDRLAFPLFVIDGFDVTLYRSVSELEGDIEGIDAVSGDLKAFDARGRAIELGADGYVKGWMGVRPGVARVASAEEQPSHQDELRVMLADHLNASGCSVDPDWSLEELVALCQHLPRR